MPTSHAQSASFEQICHFRQIQKRDGRTDSFQFQKIANALQKAAEVTGEFDSFEARRLTIRVIGLAQMALEGQIPTVEDIQDLVEEVLLASPYKKTAKAYIVYREQRTMVRSVTSAQGTRIIDQYLDKLDWRIEENSNMNYSLQGLNHYISSEISQRYWLHTIYPKEVREAHLEGNIHIHDLGLLSTYCVGWDLQDLLCQGFCGVKGKAVSRPAKHFRAALGQIVNFFYTLQGEAAGAQAFSNFDTLLAPFIRYDALSYREVKQALQEFVFNLNVPTRVGFQTPFTNLTMDLNPPQTLASQPVIVGGESCSSVYGDFGHEMTMINQAFMEVMTEGDAQGRVFTFPIPTYNIGSDFDWDNPELDGLWKATAKYGIPYFANFINADLNPEDARSMCCRLRLDTRELEKRGGGLFGANPLTGSIGVVTINLAALGVRADSISSFLDLLGQQMRIARTSLEIKRKVLEDFTVKGLYPYTRYYLRTIHDRFQKYWSNHFSTIGVIGGNEACLNLLGKDIGTSKGKAFAAEILDYIRSCLQDFQDETGNMYNLEATPAEGTGYRLARKDRDRFPEMVCSLRDEQDGTPLYTNSTQLPVNYSEDVLEVLDLQDVLQSKYTGGTVLHVFLGEAFPDPEAVKQFVRMTCENYHLPYFTLSPTFSICCTHGYINGEHKRCPSCGSETEVYSRVVGYMRPVSQWNAGKRAEFAARSNYHLEEC
ncbi:ribonucleoside triphosphate reductase [Desulfogranum japonicum]|uniref:ribonucleoside triphosphate reductase n=1 Tax=Desulfogranum japonicum TaxID=231447 RepID=UPI0004294E75|nr:ribonucleoside triphosphate reductase [Desulfogranum japonicum]